MNNDILDAREHRSTHIQQLMDAHPSQSIVILKTNVVGANKNPVHMRFVCAFFNDLVIRTFPGKIRLMGKKKSLDGDYCFYVIDEVGTLVKERTIELEEYNNLGRLIDMDVYHKKPISRQDLQCDMRKCLICDNYAHMCARNKTHTEEEIHTKIQEIIAEFLIEYLSNLTVTSIYSELELYPKFGLVSHRDSGCHTDMNYETFVRSTFAIRRDIEDYIREGCRPAIDINRLVAIGKRAEGHMLQATGGVNTHKGLIFLLGVFLPALANAIIENKTESYLISFIRHISDYIVGDHFERLTPETAKTNGDFIYLEHGLKGIRGEAQSGLKTMFETPSVRHFRDDIVHHEYLIQLMSRLDDTTIVHKAGIDTLREVQSEMKDIIETGGYRNNQDRVKELSESYKERCISPGGSADLLVLKIIYEDVKHLLNQFKEDVQ